MPDQPNSLLLKSPTGSSSLQFLPTQCGSAHYGGHCVLLHVHQASQTLLAAMFAPWLACRARHMLASSLLGVETSGCAALLVNHAVQSQQPTIGFHTILCSLPSSVQTRNAVLIVKVLLSIAAPISISHNIPGRAFQVDCATVIHRQHWGLIPHV